MSIINLLNSDNSISINSRVINIFGLNTAVYVSLLLKIISKAETKNKLINQFYFKLDRKYVFSQTTLTVEEQLKIDEALMKLNILQKDPNNPDILYFDVMLFVSIVSNEDVKLITDIKDAVAIKKKTKKETQRQSIINTLKDSIACSNYELQTALREWIDSIYSNPNGYLSKTAVKEFQDTLNNYTKGDLDLALRIVKIASIQGYKMCDWAIDVYERDERNKKRLQNQNMITAAKFTTQRKVSSSNELSDTVF